MKGTLEIVTVTRVCHAPIEQVFNAWVDPSIMKLWWTPDPGWPVGAIEVEAVVGGGFSVDFAPPGEQAFTEIGTYLEFDPPNRIVYTEHVVRGNETMHGPAPCAVAFRSVHADRTEVTVRSTLGPGEEAEPRRRGWSASLDLLVVAVQPH